MGAVVNPTERYTLASVRVYIGQGKDPEIIKKIEKSEIEVLELLLARERLQMQHIFSRDVFSEVITLNLALFSMEVNKRRSCFPIVPPQQQHYIL